MSHQLVTAVMRQTADEQCHVVFELVVSEVSAMMRTRRLGFVLAVQGPQIRAIRKS